MTIDIIRRDTLAARELIASPLERLTAHYPQLALVGDDEPGTVSWPGLPEDWAFARPDTPGDHGEGEPAA